MATGEGRLEFANDLKTCSGACNALYSLQSAEAPKAECHPSRSVAVAFNGPDPTARDCQSNGGAQRICALILVDVAMFSVLMCLSLLVNLPSSNLPSGFDRWFG